MGQFKWTDRQIREGRGQGTGEHYLPWIHVRDFSSKGKASRFKSWKSGRTIQCFSDIETAFAYLLEWSDAIVDYYEQFPLLPLEETIELADRLGVRIPVANGEPRVRTTDFVIDFQAEGQLLRRARSIKPAKELSVRAKVLALELERQFWAVRSTDWAIITENEIPWPMAKNIEWVHSARTLDDHEHIATLPLADILPVLRIALDAQDQPLAIACLEVDRKLGLELGTSLFLVRHQLATKAWRIDMHQAIKTQDVLRLHPAESADECLERGVA
ncbi:TnsA endonuclease C-terminal domain-containing protein [Thermomonas sp. HDW16]|uniref:TnsA endonuclease C-terminal domain-containing protein n=1 Tax=Thermomonas sp. HDW16 TaxID=2714945 RepID=UPI00140AEBFD|nr:TnsA endonuclease C-terminal domain-containing protein [Thermomonas sp. HDW16]QIL19745.1 heteromeric transposase endonuclease subunit TnsA [Thermomonas sp. HDW16]